MNKQCKGIDIAESLQRRALWLLMGLPFDALTIEQTAEVIRAYIQRNQRCFLSTPNINFTIVASEDPDFFDSVAASDLSIVDGMPLVWLAKAFGVPISERVAGSDLFYYLSEHETERPIRVFFFGGEKGIAEKAHQELNKVSRGMVSVGFYAPGFVGIDDMSQQSVIDAINSSNADFLLVALGAKKGQAWIMRNQDKLNIPIISHLGAVINFVAGHVVRAPEKWQKTGLEWLWRVKQEPALWRRYLKDACALLKILLFNELPYCFYERLYKPTKIDSSPVTLVKEHKLILSGSFLYGELGDFEQKVQYLIDRNSYEISLDMTNVFYVDRVFMAKLVILRGLLNKLKGELILLNPSRKVTKLMRLAGILKHFKIC